MAISVKTIGGGGIYSSDVTATKAKIFATARTVAFDSNDEVVNGEMQEWDGTYIPPTTSSYNAQIFKKEV